MPKTGQGRAREKRQEQEQSQTGFCLSFQRIPFSLNDSVGERWTEKCEVSEHWHSCLAIGFH